jgi:hypothetical protein
MFGRSNLRSEGVGKEMSLKLKDSNMHNCIKILARILYLVGLSSLFPVMATSRARFMSLRIFFHDICWTCKQRPVPYLNDFHATLNSFCQGAINLHKHLNPKSMDCEAISLAIVSGRALCSYAAAAEKKGKIPKHQEFNNLTPYPVSQHIKLQPCCPATRLVPGRT